MSDTGKITDMEIALTVVVKNEDILNAPESFSLQKNRLGMFKN